MSALEDFDSNDAGWLSKFQDNIVRTYMIYQRYVDKSTPHVTARWISFTALALLFSLRILLYQGFYVVAYAWAIYLLNIFLLFLSPKFAPADPTGAVLAEDYEDDGDSAGLFDSPQLPTSGGGRGGRQQEEDFRPFIRRLPEFKFWYNATWSTCVALGCTLFDFFDIPVFWPILLMYFFFLFFLTMRRQIHHMVKYKYVPFDIGKKSYSGIGRK